MKKLVLFVVLLVVGCDSVSNYFNTYRKIQNLTDEDATTALIECGIKLHSDHKEEWLHFEEVVKYVKKESLEVKKLTLDQLILDNHVCTEVLK
jgi:hypothetical protein